MSGSITLLLALHAVTHAEVYGRVAEVYAAADSSDREREEGD